MPPETPLPEEVFKESITENIVKQQDTEITEAKNVGPKNEAVSEKVVIRRDTFSLPRTLSVDKIPEVLLETQKQYVSVENPPKQIIVRRDTYSLPRALSVDKIPEVIPETQKQYMELHFSDESDEEVLLKSEKGFRENEIAEEGKESEQVKMDIADPGERKEHEVEPEKRVPLERNEINEGTLETAKEQINGEIQCNQKVADLAIHTEDEEKARHEDLTCQEVSYVIDSKNSFPGEIETGSRMQPNLHTGNPDDTLVSVTPVTDVSLIEIKSDIALNDSVVANQVTGEVENKFTVVPSIPTIDDVVDNWKAQREALTEKRNQFLVKENELLIEENKNQAASETQNEILIVPSVPTIDDVVDNWKAEREALAEKRKQFLLNEHEVLSEENKDYIRKEERAFWKIRRDQMWKKREAFLKESEDAIDDLILAKTKSNASNSELSSNSSVINDDNFPEQNSRPTSPRPVSGDRSGEKASRTILKESIPQELIPDTDADDYTIQKAPASSFSDNSIPKEPNQSIDDMNETKFVKHFGNSSSPVESDQEHNLTKDEISEHFEEETITHQESLTTLDIVEETKQKDHYSESIHKTPTDNVIEAVVQMIEDEPPENIPKASTEGLVVQTLQTTEEEPSKHALPTKECNGQTENILETTGLSVVERALENLEEEQAKPTLHVKQSVIQPEHVSKAPRESVVERTLQRLEEEPVKPTLHVKQSVIQPENIPKAPRESVVERTLQRLEEEPVKPSLHVKQSVIQPENIPKAPRESVVERTLQRLEEEPVKPTLPVKQSVIQPENIPKAPRESVVERTLQRLEEEPVKPTLPVKQSVIQPENIPKAPKESVVERTLQKLEGEPVKPVLTVKQSVIQPENVAKAPRESVVERTLQRLEEEPVKPTLPVKQSVIQPENIPKAPKESVVERTLQKLEGEPVKPVLTVKQSVIQPENVAKAPRESVVERTLQRLEEEPVKPTLLVKQSVIQPENIPKAPRESVVERTLQRLEEEPVKPTLPVKQSVIQPENIPKAPRESVVERTLQRLEEEPVKPTLPVKQSVIQPENIPKAPKESVVERTLQKLEGEPVKPVLTVKQSVIQPENVAKAPRESVVERTLQRLEEEPVKPTLLVKQSVIQPENIPKVPRESVVERTLQRLEEDQEDVTKNAGSEIVEKVVVLHDVPADRLFENIQSDSDEESKKLPFIVKQSIIEPIIVKKAPRESVVERSLQKLEEISKEKNYVNETEYGEDEQQNGNEEESIIPVQLEESIAYTLVDKFHTKLEDNSEMNSVTGIPSKTVSNRDEKDHEGDDSEDLITPKYLEETIDLNNLDSLHAKPDRIPESLSTKSSPRKTPTQSLDVINEVFDNLSDAIEAARKQVIEVELNHAGTEGQENEEYLTYEIELDEETEGKSDIFAAEEIEKVKAATVVENNDAVNNEDPLERPSAEISEDITPVSVKNDNYMAGGSVLDVNDRVAVADETFEPMHNMKVQEEQSNVNEGALPVEIQPDLKRNENLDPVTELQGETTKILNTSFTQETNASLENEKVVETNTAITSKQSNMQQDFHSATVTELKDSHLRVSGNDTEIPLKQEESVPTFSQISVDEKQMLVSSLELIRSESEAAIEIIENLSKNEKKFGEQAVKKGSSQPITKIQDEARLAENQNITINIRKTERAISAPLGQSTPFTTSKLRSISVQEEFYDTDLQGFYEDITRNVSQINTTEASVVNENEDMVPPDNIGTSNRSNTSPKENELLKDSPENVALDKNVSINDKNIVQREFVDSGIVDESIDVTTITEDGVNESTLPSYDIFNDDNPSADLERDGSFLFQGDFHKTLKNTKEESRQHDEAVSSQIAEENAVTEEEQSEPAVNELSKEAHELDQNHSLTDRPSKEKLDKTTFTEKINKADLAVQVSTEEPNTARSVAMQNLKDIGEKDKRSSVLESLNSQGMMGIEKIKLDIKLEGLLVVDKVQTIDKATLTGSIEETELQAQTDAEISNSAEPLENENLETIENQNLTEVKPVSNEKSDVIESVESQKSVEIEYLENKKLKVERPVPNENLDEVAEEEQQYVEKQAKITAVKTADQATLTDYITKEEKETQADNEMSDIEEPVKLGTFIGGSSEHDLQAAEEVRDSSQELNNAELIKDLDFKKMQIKNEEPEVQTGNQKLLELLSNKTEVCDKPKTLTKTEEKATLTDTLINEETLVQTDELENETLHSQRPVKRDTLVGEYNKNDLSENVDVLEEMETLNQSFSVASGKFSFTPDSESYENERKTHISVYDPIDLVNAPADQAYAIVNDKKPISRVASLKSMKFDTEPSQELSPSIDNSGNGSLNIATLKTLTGESVTVESDSDILPKDTTYSDTANNTSDDEHLYPRLPPDDFKGLYNLKPPASYNGDNTSGGSFTESSRPASEDEGVITYQRLPPDDFRNTNEMRLLKTPFQRVFDDETSFTDNSVSEMDGIIRYQRLPPDDYKTALHQTQGNVESYKHLGYQDQEITRYSRLKSVDMSRRSFGSPITNERIPASPIITNRQPQKYTIDKKFVSLLLSFS